MFKSNFFETLGLQIGRTVLTVIFWIAAFFSLIFVLIASPAMAAVVAPVLYVAFLVVALTAFVLRMFGGNALRAIRRARRDAKAHEAQATYYWQALSANPAFSVALGGLNPFRLAPETFSRVINGYNAICAEQMAGFQRQYMLDIPAAVRRSPLFRDNFAVILRSIHATGALGSIELPEPNVLAAQGFVGRINGPLAITEQTSRNALMRLIALGFVAPVPLEANEAVHQA